jgi:hypothetical protein
MISQKKMVALIACLGLCLSRPAAAPLRAQESPEQEALLESDEEGFDPEEVLARLEQLHRCPLDPNRASFTQLERIPYLSGPQIRGILAARKESRFSRLDDLLRASGMDRQTLARVRPFLKIRPRQGVRGQLRSRTAWTLPLSRAYREGLYWGDATGAMVRLQLLYGDLLWVGVVTEKDPGERDLTDHHAFFLQLSPAGPLRRLVLGHYALEYGQGVALWTAAGGGTGTGGSVADLKRKSRGIRPHTSTEENGALFGGAVSIGRSPLTVDLFASQAGRDAGLNEDRSEESVTGLSASGLHRTDGELEKKDALQETVIGVHATISQSGDKSLGLTWYRVSYRPELRPADPVRQRYGLRGSRWEVVGADWDLVLGAVEVFGEAAAVCCPAVPASSAADTSSAAFSDAGIIFTDIASASRGILAGIRLRVGTIRTGLVWRRYPADFLSPRGSAAAVKDDQNENGLQAALQWQPARRTRLQLLADEFRRPWRSYDLAMPSTGERWTLRAVQGLYRGITVQLRLRWKREDAAVPASANISAASAGTAVNAPVGLLERCDRRIQIDWPVSRVVALRARLETSRVRPAGEYSARRGMLLAAQIKVDPDDRIRLRGSVALFRVPDYQGRIYLCEVGPRGMARNVALFGRGSRTVALLEGEPMESVRLSMRFAATVYDQCRTISSGPDLINWNVKREIVLQLDWSW